MTKAQIQVESWWKVEMMLLLTEMQEQTNIRSWHTEVRGRTSRRRLDFKIELQGHDTAVLGLKTALCGVQMSKRESLTSHIGGPSGGLIFTDVRRLISVESDYRFSLVFAYPSPFRRDWDKAMRNLARKAQGHNVELARLDEEEEGKLSVGWLEVSQ